MREQIRCRLLELAEPNYRDFSSALIPGAGTMLGVRLPKLRVLAKTIAQEQETYFSEPCGELFEERMLRGMVIGCMRCSTEQRIQRIQEFLPLIDNWSVCDSFCCGLKEARRQPQIYWELLLACLHQTSEFQVRFGVVMMLDYFAHDDWLPQVLTQLEQLSHPGHYVKMAEGWAISVCYIRNAPWTWQWLQHVLLDEEIERMAFQKILDSRRVMGEDRVRIWQLRQKKKEEKS